MGPIMKKVAQTGLETLIDNMPEMLSEHLALIRSADSSEVPGRDDSTALSAVGGDGLLYAGVPGLCCGAGEH